MQHVLDGSQFSTKVIFATSGPNNALIMESEISLSQSTPEVPEMINNLNKERPSIRIAKVLR